MLEQQGQVVALAGNRASVRLGGSSGCSACDAGKGCGAGIFARLFKRKPTTLEFVNELDVRVGQAVIVGLPESLFLSLVFRLYLLPLLIGLAGMLIGHYISLRLNAQGIVSDGATLLGGIAGGSIAILWNRKVPIEFSRKKSVHLIHISGQTTEEQCGPSVSFKDQ